MSALSVVAVERLKGSGLDRGGRWAVVYADGVTDVVLGDELEVQA